MELVLEIECLLMTPDCRSVHVLPVNLILFAVPILHDPNEHFEHRL